VCPSITVLISDLNVLIMNYLVHQGYPSAAVSFAREANLALSKESVESITARMEVRNKIHAGDIEGAIHDINTLNPQVAPRTLAQDHRYGRTVHLMPP
jgi:hypothetical protein